MSPTFDRSDSFKRDYKRLGPEKQETFKASAGDFISDVTAIEEGRATDCRRGLRVKPMQDNDGIWEMTWEQPDGRATFEWGESPLEDKRHVRWRRIGDHRIFDRP